MKTFQSFAIGVLCMSAFSSVGSAAVITLQEGLDGYEHVGLDIRGGTGGANNSVNLVVGRHTGDPGSMRGVLGFDLSSIPAGSTINSVTLVMTVLSGDGTASNVGTINLHQLTPGGSTTNTIVETQANWTLWSTGNSWTTPGGDYGPAIASSTVTTYANGTAQNFASAILTETAQSLFDAGSPLQLILISPNAEATGHHFVRFHSDNSTTQEYRPQLIIDYTIPEPSTGFLILFASSALLGLRNRRI